MVDSIPQLWWKIGLADIVLCDLGPHTEDRLNMSAQVAFQPPFTDITVFIIGNISCFEEHMLPDRARWLKRAKIYQLVSLNQ